MSNMSRGSKPPALFYFKSSCVQKVAASHPLNSRSDTGASFDAGDWRTNRVPLFGLRFRVSKLRSNFGRDDFLREC
jgi:hypothetical protein